MAFLASASMVLGTVAAVPAAQAKDSPGGADGGLSVWTAEVSRAQVPLLLEAGVDGHELTEQVPATGKAPVEVILTPEQAGELEAEGVRLTERTLSSAAERRAKAAGDGVFRPYSGPGGLKQEIVDTGRANPGLTKVVSIGKSLKGQDILAVKVSKDAKKTKDGRKPSVLYMSNQHAREWITPEMTRRLMHHYLDGYGKNDEITKIVDTTELWFVLSANPDGYDFTHADPANRMWRKNLRDNDGDGKITDGVDGVDLNRNFAYKWGYDNEGSSPDPGDETFRGKSPGSEPETKAIDAFERRMDFEYGINYHSAAELLLYGVGWQVATPTPDDILYEALAGTPENSAIPGYRPQVSSELYTTNGEADGHAANVNGTLMFTPEMSTCRTASAVDPDDEWIPSDCGSVFHFPDDETLIQQEFEKNIPFALSVAKSAARPDQPQSSLDLKAADFTPDTFTTSYARGDQDVAVTARKSVRHKRLNYRIDGGRSHSETLKPWRGGERFGGDDNLYFDEYRAEVDGARAGDEVEVWFTGRTAQGKRTSSEPFTYTVAERPRADTLVIAEEGGTTAAKHAQTYVDALRANGHRAAVWDVATQGAPHALGVLDHFESAVWYTGAARPGGATLLAVRSYLNEGGKLIQAGEFAGGPSVVGRAATDDFSQYYLGAGDRFSLKSPPKFDAAGALGSADATLGDAADNPLNLAGGYTVTSDALPPEQFPQFRSASGGAYLDVKSPFEPFEGDWFAAAEHRDDSWMRLSRTVDLTGVTAADAPELRFQLSYNTEPGYDNVLMEAHTEGQDDWTTLPEANGATNTGLPDECEAGFYAAGHPFLLHYLTVNETSCDATGSTGSWNRFSGASDGWQEVTFDLSAYAGKKAVLSLSYVTDPGSGGRGVFTDATRLVVGGQERDNEGFETSLGAWTVPGAPEGSPGNTTDWARSQKLFDASAAVTTHDSVLLGFGLEHVASESERARLVGAALRHLLRRH